LVASTQEIGDLRRQIRRAEKDGEGDEALRLLGALCIAEPNDLRSLEKYGQMLLAARRFEEGHLALERCASGYATEGLLNKAIKTVKTLIQHDPSDQRALRGLQGLYARRQGGRRQAGPIPGFEPPPFEVVGLTEEPPRTEDKILIPREITDPGLAMPLLDFPANSSSRVYDALTAPEHDMGELLASGAQTGHQAVPADGAVSDLPLFAELPLEAQRMVAEHLVDHQFGAGEPIFSQGERDGTLWLIREGRVEVRRALPRGRQVVLARLGSGSVLGEMSLFNDSPRSASAVSLGPVRASGLSLTALDTIWSAYPAVRDNLLRNYRLRHLRNLVAHAPFMRHLPPAHRRGVAMLFRVREVSAGTVLIRPGPRGDGTFGILGGQVRVEARGPSGELRQVAMLSTGSLFGLGSEVVQLENPFRFVASGRASILRLDGHVLTQLIDTHLELAAYLEELAHERVHLAAKILESQDLFCG
jgi:CRP-like cAMP-binding protein